MRRLALPIAVPLAILVAGCTVGPTYERPNAGTPDTFRGGDTDGASLADLPWWQVYDDPELQGLIREALANNLDLKLAVARIEQARAIAAKSRAALYPEVSYGVGLGGGRNEFTGGPSFNNGETQASFAGVISAAWEFDIWGRLHNLSQADMDDLLSTEQARRAIRLSLVSDVAQAYFELLELDRDLEIAKMSTVSFTETVRIFTLRRDYGTASNLEVSRGEAALAEAAAQVPRSERAIALKENQINTLLGRAPRDIQRGGGLLSQRTPPEVPAGIPAQLLDRRPDILAVEAQVRAANARIGANEALKLPRIGLSGFVGEVSPDLADISSAGLAWSVAANMAGPIFNAGFTDAQIAEAKAIWQQAVINYDRTVLIALREVADSLSSRIKLAEQRTFDQQAVNSYQESVNVAMERYMAGKSSYYEVLDAQQHLYPSEYTLARTQAQQLITIVQLYKALGGGWQLDEAQWSGLPEAQAASGTTP